MVRDGRLLGDWEVLLWAGEAPVEKVNACFITTWNKVGFFFLYQDGLISLLGQGCRDWHPDSGPGNFIAHRLLVL